MTNTEVVSAMRRPVLITTPFPTVGQVAKMMGVSQRRVKELVKLAEDLTKERRPAKKNETVRASSSGASSRPRGR